MNARKRNSHKFYILEIERDILVFGVDLHSHTAWILLAG